MGERVKVSCDACGRTSVCGEKSFAPKGWFYVQLAMPGDTSCCSVLACSEACKSLPWKQVKS